MGQRRSTDSPGNVASVLLNMYGIVAVDSPAPRPQDTGFPLQQPIPGHFQALCGGLALTMYHGVPDNGPICCMPSKASPERSTLSYSRPDKPRQQAACASYVS